MGSMMGLEDLISSIGVSHNHDEVNSKYHLFIIGKNHKKLFFYEDGVWGEDINKRAETTDFIFAYKTIASMLEEEEMRNHIEANLVF